MTYAGRAVAWLCSCLVLGCGSAPTVTYCDIEPILATRCVRCHGEPPQNHAPFSLIGYAATQENYVDQPIYERMATATRTGIMPPVTLSVTPPVTDLEASEVETIAAWADAGAPSGGCE